MLADPSTIASLTYNSRNVSSPTTNNTIITSNNNHAQSNNTVSSNNTVTSQANNTVNPPNNTVTPQRNNTVTSSNNTTSQQNNAETTPHTCLTITIPACPPAPPITTLPPVPPAPPIPTLHRSARIQALNRPPASTEAHNHALAFLSEYSTVQDTHDLIPTDIVFENDDTSIDEILSALSDGSLQPTSTEGEDEPTWAQAMASEEREYWIAGGHDELKSLQDLKVFILVPRSELPRGHRPLKGKLVCKKKRDDTGRVVRYKVRYVAKGFAQRYGIDYDKTTAPTVRLESFQTILHLAASLDWDLQQFDIKTAFLHGILPEDETMFMEQPSGFEAPGKEDWVMRLMKSIYGMKQASRIWNQTFHNAISQMGFKRLNCKWCVYRRTTPTGTVIFAVHVDDIIAAGSSPEELDSFRDSLKAQWEITELGEPKFALGIAISRDRNN
jgi:hypothetical protein